jgi:hypothetical protein
MTPLWWLTRDGDPDAYALARRHYSAWKNKTPKQRQFVGPGEKVVLITEDKRAVFAWRRERFHRLMGDGVCCTIFRNEGPHRSSDLIRQAGRIADAIWPNLWRYTFVAPGKIASKNPGYCFKLAGWELVRLPDGRPRTTKRGQLIFVYSSLS